MKEFELRWKVDDLADVQSRARDLGFTVESDERQKDTYYLNGSLDAEGVRVWLRVRENGSIDLKREISELEKHETSVKIDQPAHAHALLQALGYSALLIVEKHRVTMRRGSVRLMLDDVENLGTFVEIEMLDVADKAEEKIRDVARSVGLPGRDVKTGYPDMLTRSS